ncbi:chloride channel protein [Nitratiruptor sp. YY09-18]|uniref:chloride channel protein n=1 Tax=Nitratiruptor sp. YY09-18 TaxID=2724901 RepID=UPI001916301D|nr:chloride channel protein [Nitratiruptor sp. YY09-18]BCD67554.1 chloride channel protein, CIC family [Nitratiruptor sp. YY09-18]
MSISTLYSNTKFYTINIFITNRFEKHRNIIFALIGSGTIGTLFFIAPYATFSGHELVNYLINDKVHISITLLIVTILHRIIATTISIYANAIGVLFITLMSIGALIGYGFGEVMVSLGFFIEPFYYAAIGASVFMGTIMELPLTAVIAVLEITYDYNVIISTGIIVALVNFMIPQSLRGEQTLIRKMPQ